VVDGLYLAELADVVLFVVKWSGTPQQQVKSAITALEAAKKGATPLMLVLNQQNPKAAGYGAKYGAYYGYN
jgi:Mrp family chromosome partitioning ATPase